jgi:HD-like signal output (HDOD) protein
MKTAEWAPAAFDGSPVVDACLQDVRDVQTLPTVAAKIMDLMSDSEVTTADVTKLVEVDPALCMRILKIANSSFYGFSSRVDTIHRAVVLLGLNAVKGIALAAGFCKLFRSDRIHPQFDAHELWVHSVAVATGARMLAKDSGRISPEEAFFAGLIHDIGLVIEMQACRKGFAGTIEAACRHPNAAFREIELQTLGATHEAFGAAICQAWKLPASLINVAGYHHRPLELPPAKRTLPAVVHVADILAAQLGRGYSRTVETDAINPQISEEVKLDPTTLDALQAPLTEQIDEAQQLLAD